MKRAWPFLALIAAVAMLGAGGVAYHGGSTFWWDDPSYQFSRRRAMTTATADTVKLVWASDADLAGVTSIVLKKTGLHIGTTESAADHSVTIEQPPGTKVAGAYTISRGGTVTDNVPRADSWPHPGRYFKSSAGDVHIIFTTNIAVNPSDFWAILHRNVNP